MCLACTNDSNTSCTSCNPTLFRTLVSNSSCICMDGYFQVDIFTAMCSKCNYTCMTCVNAYDCLSCNPIKNRVVSPTNSSVCICASGYYDSGN